ncbi:MAG: vitamin B12 dependent-methionine synthase activation domain-containing protein [Candidatus Thorarchaeota archaeon]
MIHFIKDIEIKLSIHEVVKLLQKEGKNSKQPSQKLLTEISNLLTEAKQDIEPKAIYGIFSSEQFSPKYIFSPSEQTIFAICTISDKLEKRITQLLNSNELAKGVIFDAIASHAAEETAEEVNRRILLENKELFHNKNYTRRFSPGYCLWELSEGQKQIFDLLPGEKIGVQLNSSMLMIPRKSVSFAINIGKKVNEELGQKECSTCEEINCTYRRS